MFVRVAAVCLLCSLSAVAQAPKPSELPKPAPAPNLAAAEQQIMEADRNFNRATAQRRAEGWLEFMADNAVILRATPLVGKEAIREAYAKLFADTSFTLSWEPIKAEVFAPGGVGYTVGKFTSTQKPARCGGGTVTSYGRYLTTWQKQKDGSWKVIADAGSTEGSTGCGP